MLTAITGVNWGDEGKGRMVDLLSERQDIVVRYQGGNNAGHTVVNEKGAFILNLLPSGILREEVVNVMGPGMAVDIEHLCGELDRLREAGIRITPERLKISGRAIICMPWHKQQDRLEEDRLGDAKFGSTQRGISPVYGDKYMKKALRLGDLLEPHYLRERLQTVLPWKNLTLTGIYGARALSFEETLGWLQKYGRPLLPYLCDTGVYLEEAIKKDKRILFEAQLGALRDIDYGIYPYTSSSNTLSGYAPIGAGIPGRRLDESIGVMKAYSTCVGEGPFTCEWFGEEAQALRQAGAEYGAATGRPRRVGPFDVPASRYGVRLQGAHALALTKLDVLSYLDEIPVCTAYEVEGRLTREFPVGAGLRSAKPVYKKLRGWKKDVSGCRRWEQLPLEAQQYIRFLEEQTGAPVRYVSVGAHREAYIRLD
ncbi:MAG: adenylosuccinate synthase [Oscillospiraceae bacterium]|nr:adenylosuccinate synthase [Oscillospiraceae bacterium]